MMQTVKDQSVFTVYTVNICYTVNIWKTLQLLCWKHIMMDFSIRSLFSTVVASE